ncbi:hypothetical protein [Streptomyces sp. NPDC058964]|uniref:hypothetical protein n=1 Tax=Streptomyces sp. NPDC058964 TaxID=3346681 RepID=UPI0036ADDC3F
MVLGSTSLADGTHTARPVDLRTGRIRRSAPGAPPRSPPTAPHGTSCSPRAARRPCWTSAPVTAAPWPHRPRRPGAVSRDGRAVVFLSTAGDLVPDGTSGVPDIFFVRTAS